MIIEALELQVIGDADGCFHLDLAESGRFRLAISQSGFVSEKMYISVPHFGQYTNLKIRLTPVRYKILESYVHFLNHMIPEKTLWGTFTPREVKPVISGKLFKEHELLDDLTVYFEDAYYGNRRLEEDAYHRAQEMMDKIVLMHLKSGFRLN
jgi:hypothetical protein